MWLGQVVNVAMKQAIMQLLTKLHLIPQTTDVVIHAMLLFVLPNHVYLRLIEASHHDGPYHNCP
ncbi:hypothetical protein D1872_315970 [compost metagenome]